MLYAHARIYATSAAVSGYNDELPVAHWDQLALLVPGKCRALALCPVSGIRDVTRENIDKVCRNL